MALINLSELKAVLGIGDIYADSIVQEVADAAENIVLSYLTFHLVGISHAELTSNVATYTTTSPHQFTVGQDVIISKCGGTLDGSKTVSISNNAYQFSVATVSANVAKQAIIPNGECIQKDQANIYDDEPEVREAALAVAADIWITRTGTLGQQGVDFQSPAPYRLGRSLFTRVSGLLAKHIDVRSYVG